MHPSPRLSIGFNLFDLLTGDLAADSISAAGVTVDPAVFSGGGDLGPPNVQAIFAALDQTVAEAADLPIDAIAISDLRLAPGNAGAPQIDRLQLGKNGRGEFDLALTATLDGTSVDVFGSALPLPDGDGLESLSLATERIDLPVTIGPDAQPSLSLSVGLDGRKGDRRLTLTATTAISRSAGDRIEGNVTASIKEGRQAADIEVDFSDGSRVSAAFAGLVDLAAAEDGRIPFEARCDSADLEHRERRDRAGALAGTHGHLQNRRNRRSSDRGGPP
ncbi:hypothetical protein [Jiella pelagia]|uniref:Uncharacterized protein n=1 Tax=Jiella pelagia TaxID=2986949 RepID=A0ABY7BZ89_9HYPH|nr:hypothetical protein [Jiella pelagia]WAP68787.1 hypothetical protein OH818_26685 [Jiella pelagia]